MPHRSQHKCSYYQHDFLIYGYNDYAKYFYTIGYTDREIYEESKISFGDTRKGIHSVKAENWLNFLKIKENYKFSFDKEKLTGLLNDYIYSRNSYNHSSSKACTFGAEAILRICERIHR